MVSPGGASPTAGIFVKRVYDPPAPGDGDRLLVDRLWPRGLSREKAQVTVWLRDLAPSDTLRKWFGHDPARWDEFVERYRAELRAAGKWDDLRALAVKARKVRLTLLFAAADTVYNNAIALQYFLAEINQEG